MPDMEIPLSPSQLLPTQALAQTQTRAKPGTPTQAGQISGHVAGGLAFLPGPQNSNIPFCGTNTVGKSWYTPLMPALGRQRQADLNLRLILPTELAPVECRLHRETLFQKKERKKMGSSKKDIRSCWGAFLCIKPFPSTPY